MVTLIPRLTQRLPAPKTGVGLLVHLRMCAPPTPEGQRYTALGDALQDILAEQHLALSRYSPMVGSPPMPLASGARLGPFEVLEPLGAGGMGEVYRARDSRLGRIVAVKVLRPDVAADPARIERFEREARAA